MLGLEFEIIPAESEEADCRGIEPGAAAELLSKAKAREVAAKLGPDETVIAADTIVWLDGELLGKPKDEADAVSMLLRLSNREHTVYTGVTVIRGDTELCRVEETRVFFRKLATREIMEYVGTGEPMDKAGAYGVQGKAAVFIERIDGDFYNVMGLPLCALDAMLKQLADTSNN